MEHTATSRLMADLSHDVARERAEFESLVRLYWPKVFRFALASLRDKDAAETIAQDCFVKAHRARGRFRNECSDATWLMRIAVNLVRDHLRNRRLCFWKHTQTHGQPVEDIGHWIDEGQRSPEAQALLRERVQAIWEATKSLPERQRTVFLLRFVEDMDLLDIAAVTGMKEGTVKTHLFRALQAVRERMGSQL